MSAITAPGRSSLDSVEVAYGRQVSNNCIKCYIKKFGAWHLLRCIKLVTFSGRCVGFFKCICTEVPVCTELQCSVKMGSQNNRKWQTSTILIAWAIDRAFHVASLSLLPCSWLSPPLVFLCIWTAAWSSTLPPTMCRHIACGVICLVFVILFDDLLNVLIIFVLFVLVNHFTRWA